MYVNSKSVPNEIDESELQYERQYEQSEQSEQSEQRN
jgi:hypothetical protein